MKLNTESTFFKTVILQAMQGANRMKPILFNTQMVQAILENRKSVTRRVIKLSEGHDHLPNGGFWKQWSKEDNCYYIKNYAVHSCWWEESHYIKAFAPYLVGDILYVRETFFQYGEWMEQSVMVAEDEYKTKYFFSPKGNKEIYFIDTLPDDVEVLSGYKSGRGYYKRPSIHMPKEAARIFLKVTDVRIEQLKDITEEQAIKEGFANRVECIKAIRKIYDIGLYDWLFVNEFEVIEKEDINNG